MTEAKRLMMLKIGAAAMAGLLLLNYLVINPAMAAWSAQSDRIDALREKVQRGQQLMDREDSIRNKWKSMLQANLPDEVSLAESEAYQAFDRWATDGGISVQSLLPNWQDHTDEGYETLECRVTAVGNLASLGRFVYDLETDPIPVNLEECELAARDESGSQLTMTARITFLRLIAPKEGSQ